jgi:hypothetical protein
LQKDRDRDNYSLAHDSGRFEKSIESSLEFNINEDNYIGLSNGDDLWILSTDMEKLKKNN